MGLTDALVPTAGFLLDTALILLSAISAYLSYVLYTEITGSHGDYHLSEILQVPAFRDDFWYLLVATWIGLALFAVYILGAYYAVTWNGLAVKASGTIFIGSTVIVFTKWLRRMT